MSYARVIKRGFTHLAGELDHSARAVRSSLEECFRRETEGQLRRVRPGLVLELTLALGEELSELPAQLFAAVRRELSARGRR